MPTTDCREPHCDGDATERVNIPGEGAVDPCAFHADAVLKLAAANGMGLGVVE